MRRPTRWYWATLLSLATFCVAGFVVLFLGLPPGPNSSGGPLNDTLEWAHGQLHGVTGDPWAAFILVVFLAVIPFFSGLAVFHLSRRHSWEQTEHLHCLKCGYILKGLSEPRCPECGEPI